MGTVIYDQEGNKRRLDPLISLNGLIFSYDSFSDRFLFRNYSGAKVELRRVNEGSTIQEVGADSIELRHMDVVSQRDFGHIRFKEGYLRRLKRWFPQ